MKLLDLQTGNQTIIDDEDWEAVSELTVYEGSNGYAYYSVWRDGKSQPNTLHSFLVPAPPGYHTDHINGNKLDNRRSNLRVVTPQQNQINRRGRNRNNSSGVRGVARTGPSRKNPWRAQIGVDGTTLHLGLFPTREAAIRARREAELEHYGELCP